MIKLAATKPAKRKADIMEGVKHLKWSEDPYLKAFGIKLSSTMLTTEARLFQNPVIEFHNNHRVNPGVSGRWDLRGGGSATRKSGRSQIRDR